MSADARDATRSEPMAPNSESYAGADLDTASVLTVASHQTAVAGTLPSRVSAAAVPFLEPGLPETVAQA